MNKMSPMMKQEMAAGEAAVQLDGVTKSFISRWLRSRTGRPSTSRTSRNV